MTEKKEYHFIIFCCLFFFIQQMRSYFAVGNLSWCCTHLCAIHFTADDSYGPCESLFLLLDTNVTLRSDTHASMVCWRVRNRLSFFDQNDGIEFHQKTNTSGQYRQIQRKTKFWVILLPKNECRKISLKWFAPWPKCTRFQWMFVRLDDTIWFFTWFTHKTM